MAVVAEDSTAAVVVGHSIGREVVPVVHNLSGHNHLEGILAAGGSRLGEDRSMPAGERLGIPFGFRSTTCFHLAIIEINVSTKAYTRTWKQKGTRKKSMIQPRL